MARRYASGIVNLTMTVDPTAAGGGPVRTLTHGLGTKPDELSIVSMTAPNLPYLKTMNGTVIVVTGKTNSVQAAAANLGRARVFAWVNHSIVK